MPKQNYGMEPIYFDHGDAHAALNTTSVYTPAVIFPMLPPELSTDLTSLNQDEDRAAMVVDMTVDDEGAVVASDVYGAIVRNKAQLTYSHSTAPNRRFPDLVIQRLLKAAIDPPSPKGFGKAGRAPTPYPLAELKRLAAHCTKQEDAANKVERLASKAAAALWLTPQIGNTFDAVVTGAGPKGTWVRLVPTPVEGRLERGFAGLDVGDRVRVRLLSTDPQRGFIDFARANV